MFHGMLASFFEIIIASAAVCFLYDMVILQAWCFHVKHCNDGFHTIFSIILFGFFLFYFLFISFLVGQEPNSLSWKICAIESYFDFVKENYLKLVRVMKFLSLLSYWKLLWFCKGKLFETRKGHEILIFT